MVTLNRNSKIHQSGSIPKYLVVKIQSALKLEEFFRQQLAFIITYIPENLQMDLSYMKDDPYRF